MSGETFLTVDPSEIKFPFEVKKQITCSLQLLNKTDSYVAFKVKTTNPKKYSVKPNNGIVLPRSICNVTVTMQAQNEAPQGMQCKDRFLIQSVITQPGVTPKDVKPEMFNKSGGNHVEESKLRVVYVSPPRPPSPVLEDSDEGLSDYGISTLNDYFTDTNPYDESQENTSGARDVILKLMNERDSIIQQNDQLRRELNLLKNGPERASSGIPMIYVLVVCLIAFILGFFF